MRVTSLLRRPRKTRPDLARIITKADAKQLLRDGSGDVTGHTYEKAGQDYSLSGPVIFCSGGLGADHTQQPLLAKYCPELMLPSTASRELCASDGIEMGEAICARTVATSGCTCTPLAT
jgi:hypothetical protein